MTKRIIALVIVLISLLVLAGCGSRSSGCDHDWEDATCSDPKTCRECGKTKGEALGHDWEDATCSDPKTCKECGKTKGKALGHDWEDATCLTPKTCRECGKTDGEALGHNWSASTRTEPSVCLTCGEIGSVQPEGIVEEFVCCFIDADVGGMFDLINPDMLDYAMEEEGMSKSDLNDLADELSEELEAMYEYIEEMYGEKLKMSYEITDEWELDEDELEDIQSEYDEAGVEIEAAEVFEVDFTMEVADEEQTQSLEIVVIKVDGKWYVEMGSLEDAF